MGLELCVEDLFRTRFGGPPYKHQRKAAEALLEGRSVVVRAPCGSGKTEAAIFPYLLGKGSALPRRLIYSLPTRSLVENVAGRIDKDLNELKTKIEEIYVSRQHGANSKDPFFKGDIVITTIDQTVGAYCCTPLSLPEYLGNIPAGAAVSSLLCFDEVHTYHHDLGLKTMLVLISRSMKLGLPFLVMSATLPNSFIDWFRDKKVEIVEGSDNDVPYRKDRFVTLEWKEKKLEPQDILELVDERKRTMVVCNTVTRAQQLYRSLKGNLRPLFLLHSRFLSRDRKKIEEKMLDAFKEESKRGACLISTQVCEVGLDISCDVLLTELAPPDALIQRMGRCARRGGVGRVYVYDVEHHAPYEKEIMEECRKYLLTRLDGKKMDWNRELDFVDALLDEKFKSIVNDKKGQMRILSELGKAAFQGDKARVERTVREVFSANVTLHEDPDNILDKIWHMPWLNVDVRVLQRERDKYGIKVWEVGYKKNIGDEVENRLFSPSRLYPYRNYVLHPRYVRYDENEGLIFGEAGQSFEPVKAEERDPRERPKYDFEPWIEHVDRCLESFRLLRDQELPLHLFSELMGMDESESEGILALSVALHDLGKLNKDWQKAIGIRKEDIEPLAHFPRSFQIGRRPPHAAVSGYSLQRLFAHLIKAPSMRRHAIILAISHHHHSRIEEVCRYDLGWRHLVQDVIEKINDDFGLSANPEDIIWHSPPASIKPCFPNIENVKAYTVYSITSRIIRLCDQEAAKKIG